MNEWMTILDLIAIHAALLTIVSIYPHKRSLRRPTPFLAGALALNVALYILFSFYGVNTFYTNALVYPALAILYGVLFLDANPFCCVVCVLLISSTEIQLVAIINNGAIALFHVTSTVWTTLNTRLFPRLFLVAVYAFVRRFAVRSRERLPTAYWMSICLNFAISLCWSMLFMAERLNFDYAELVTVAFSAAFLVSGLLLYFFFFETTRQHEENIRLQLLNQRMEQNALTLREANTTYQTLRVMRHDMLNHISVMDGMLRQGQFDELKSYFRSVLKRDQPLLDFLDCGRPAINALLNLKIGYARELGISVAARAIIPPELEILDVDLCALLGNILDNATEAAQKVPDALIRMDIQPQKQYLCIKVENSADKNVLAGNPDLHTSKPEPAYHGLGLKIIRSVVEKYDGVLDIGMGASYFTVKALLTAGTAGKGPTEESPSKEGREAGKTARTNRIEP